MIAKLRWSTPVVRRDQDGGHRSENRVQRFPFFCAFVPRLSYVFARAFFPLLRGYDRQKKRNKKRTLAHPLSSSLGEGGGVGKREEENRGPRFFRGSRKIKIARRQTSSDNFSWFGLSSRYARNPDAIRVNGKLEDLVRLALKRLNVSYLTILSRLVRFERETLVCHACGCIAEKDVCGSVKFFAIKFYSRVFYYSFFLFFRYLLLTEKYLISKEYNLWSTCCETLLQVNPIFSFQFDETWKIRGCCFLFKMRNNQEKIV